VPEFLRTALAEGPAIAPALVAVRLLVALALGAAVAAIYRRTRPADAVMPTFTPTLVLLAVLIAMVTQVIGDNVARAFSLVGALSIVRFRTVVRDTEDTAYVIFAVVVGMAAGASNLWVAAIGLAIIAAAAFLMRSASGTVSAPTAAELPFLLHVRLSLGADPHAVLSPALEVHTLERRLASVATVKQGLAIAVSYATRLRSEGTAEAFVKALNALDGVQDVELQRREVAGEP
jgi:hypothetical protein